MQNHMEEYVKNLENLREKIKNDFEEYKKDPSPSKIPNIERLWDEYAEVLDTTSFLKPIICCCRELMDDESVNKDDLARDLEDLHQRIKNIQQGNHPIDII